MCDSIMKISIITVTYNAEKFLQQTIDSVMSQCYENIEYIIVDGMSSDKTWEIIQKNKQKFSCVIHEKDDGLYDAMNKGIKLATGEIIGIINADDWYEEGVFRRIVDVFESDNTIDAVYGKLTIVQADGMFGTSRTVQIEDIWRSNIPHPTLFMKKSVYLKYGLFNTKYSIVADYDLTLRFYIQGVKFFCLNENIAYFRVGGISTRRKLTAIEEGKIIRVVYNRFHKNPYEYKQYIDREYHKNVLKSIYEIDDCIFTRYICGEKNINKIYIWGAGFFGKLFVDKFHRCGVDIVAVIDSNPKLLDETISNIPVISADSLITHTKVFIASSDYSEIIMISKKIGIEFVNLYDMVKYIKNIYI